MPSGNAMGAQSGPPPFDTPGGRGSQLGSSILDSSTLGSSVLGKRRKSSIGTPESQSDSQISDRVVRALVVMFADDKGMRFH